LRSLSAIGYSVRANTDGDTFTTTREAILGAFRHYWRETNDTDAMLARKLTVGQHAGFPTYKAESKQAPTERVSLRSAGFSSRRPFDFGRPAAVNHRKFLRFVCILRSYCPMPNFVLIEGSSCVEQPSHENLRRKAAENAL
jgi:hypothetical protein